MGMYDTLGGEQIKIFYQPMFQLNQEEKENSFYWHSTGRLRNFAVGEPLPLKEMWYAYPENFLVYDYRGNYEDVWIIENGVLKKLTTYKKLTNHTADVPVYDYYGTLLAVNTLADFEKIKQDAIRLQEEKRMIELHFFPQGSMAAMQNNLAEYEEKKDAYFAALQQKNEEFAAKWLKSDEAEKEKEFGALFECLLYATSIQNEEEIDACVKVLQKMVRETPDIVARFKQWFGEETVQKFDFSQLI